MSIHRSPLQRVTLKQFEKSVRNVTCVLSTTPSFHSSTQSTQTHEASGYCRRRASWSGVCSLVSTGGA